MSSSKVLLRSRKKRAFSCVQEGRFDEARALYQEICRADSRDAEAWCMLGAVFGQIGRFDDAIACCRKAVALQPDYVDAQYNLAQACMHQHLLPEAVAAYRQVIRLQPDHADAHNNLGLALDWQGHYDQAIACYTEAVRLQPDHADAFHNLGNALPAIGDNEKAIECYQQVIRFRPSDPKAHASFGFLLATIGKLEEAVRIFTNLHALDPENPAVPLGQAMIYEKRGDIAAAYELVRPLLATGMKNERLALVYAKIAPGLKQHAEAVSYIEQVLATGELKGVEVSQLFYHLGKLYDQLGQYDKAFQNFEKANSLKPSCYEPEYMVRQMDVMRTIFTADFFARAPRAANNSERPIFIVGMPRSGTTLAEQILSSHPAVYGGGELKDISDIVLTLPGLAGNGKPYPECVEAISSAAVNTVAQHYLDMLAKLSPDAARVTDKMPHNFKHLGLIALMFPCARVIHCRRHPLDTCLSIYTLDFNAVHSYATNLARLGEHYCAYEKLMGHWKTVLPLPIFEIQYETLIEDQETVTRALLEFCGLEWDERCLRFHESNRAVNTFSYNQVRKPIYTQSVGRWRHYESHLGPLREALGIVDEPSADKSMGL